MVKRESGSIKSYFRRLDFYARMSKRDKERGCIVAGSTSTHRNEVKNQIEALLASRILLIDGGMGTMIQSHQLQEADYRGERFADWHSDLKGNNDLLVLTQPQLIKQIHSDYLAAGADILETNTFNATTIAMADYDMQSLSAEINFAAAKLAKQAAQEWTAKHQRNLVLSPVY